MAVDAVAIIRTPIQLLSAVEAIHVCGASLSDCVVLIQDDNPKFYERTSSLATTQNWREIRRFRSPQQAARGKGRTVRKFGVLARLNRIAREFRAARFVLTSLYNCNFVRHLCSQLSRGGAEVVLLDEGLGQIRLAGEYLEGSRRQAGGGGLSRRLLGYNPAVSDSYSIISAYDLAHLTPRNGTFRQHHFEQLRRSGEQRVSRDESTLLFLGAPVRSFGTEEFYLSKLRSAITHLKQFERRIVYSAHRHETDEMLTQVRSLGVDVQAPDRPIELHLLNGGAVPATLTGFASSALEHLRLMFPEEIDSIIWVRVPVEQSPPLQIWAQPIYDFLDAVDDPRVTSIEV